MKLVKYQNLGMLLMKIFIMIDDRKISQWLCPFHHLNEISQIFLYPWAIFSLLITRSNDSKCFQFIHQWYFTSNSLLYRSSLYETSTLSLTNWITLTRLHSILCPLSYLLKNLTVAHAIRFITVFIVALLHLHLADLLYRCARFHRTNDVYC